ncbi:hypothetical protein PybrP1_010671 [[Pythium] brassicae (nom. inval.)]|nr:hypothetical protein PybrP1_010671 [[Pythium] brassicae (nom. inval.)]
MAPRTPLRQPLQLARVGASSAPPPPSSNSCFAIAEHAALVERWLADKRELFQRVLCKPIQNRSDLDVKLLASYLTLSKSLSGLSSVSIDELARSLHVQLFHDGEVLFHQGDSILDTSARFLVVHGSLCVYKNRAYSQRRSQPGDDYTQWFLAATPECPPDAVKYGDCVGTCSAGDTCGDPSVLASSTVVTYFTQASFKRVSRYDVPNDASLLSAVSSAFRPSKPTRVDMRSTFVAATKLSDDTVGDTAQLRVLHLFFAQFPSIRLLPLSYRVELMRKVEFRVFRNDEVLCHASDTSPKLFVVLAGRVCVHYVEPLEAAQLQAYDEANYAFNPPVLRKAATRANASTVGRDCEAPVEVTARSPHGSVHVCTLAPGEAIGEVGIRERAVRQGATLFVPIHDAGPCSVLTLSYDDYAATLGRYLDATEFTLDAAHAILADTLPQDRSCEQVGYVWGFLTRQSPARVFFNQLPLFTLTKICTHACIEEYAVSDDVLEFVQREGAAVDAMRVVLSGFVCAFKKRSRVAPQSTAPQAAVAPTPAVLTRFQSRLIRANTKIADEVHAVDAAAHESISILPHGAAFGYHAIFTSAASPYSYAAYSAEAADANSHDTGAEPSSTSLVHLLSLPARFVKICFASIDEEVVYNPVRVLKRVVKDAERQLLSSSSASPSALHGHSLDRRLRLSPCFRGIPRARLEAAVAELSVAHVPARRIIYDVGESTKGVSYLVLSGHVRVFTSNARPQAVQPKPEERRTSKLLRKATAGSLEATHAALAKQASARFECLFDRYAGDHIFLRDYDRAAELVSGDCFGRQVGTSDDAHDRLNKHPTRAVMAKRASSLQPHHQASSRAGGESAVTMAECLIGSIPWRVPTEAWTLTAKEKGELTALIEMREELDKSSDACRSPDAINLSLLATSLKIVALMRIGGHLASAQRVCVANSLKYCRLKPGAVVYAQGDESRAIYFVMTGKIKL